MRSSIPRTIGALGLALGLIGSPTGHASQSDRTTSITQLPYPAEASLVQQPLGWTFESSSNDLPLYLYEPLSGKSTCNSACAKQWIPLLALPGEKPLGDWTIVVRKDGRRQWAFEQHPVYTHLHDKPDMPAGAGVKGDWRLMPYFSS